MKKQLLEISEKEDARISFMIGGIGDARHLFGSLLDIDEMQDDNQKEISSAKENKIHFTLVDINGAIVARDLVMMYVLKNLSVFSAEQMKFETAAVEVFLFIFYYILYIYLYYCYNCYYFSFSSSLLNFD